MALYLNQPDNAVVFSFDEKSSVQALDRTQRHMELSKSIHPTASRAVDAENSKREEGS